MESIKLFARRYRRDIYYKVHITIWISLSVNIAFAMFTLICALQNASFWEGALSFYRLSLCVIYAYLVRRLPTNSVSSEHLDELRTAQRVGFLLVMLDFALGGIMVQVIRMGRSYIYPSFLIYGMALFAFYSLAFAIWNVVRYRKLRNPVLSAVSVVNLTVSLMSIFALETALVTTFGNGDTVFREAITSITAITICAIVLIAASHMAVRAGKQMKDLSKTDPASSGGKLQ